MINFLKKYLSRFNKSSLGICSLSDKVVKEKQLTQVQDLFICDQHLDFYRKNDWVLIYKFSFKLTGPLYKAVHIQELREELRKHKILSYIVTEYFSEETVFYLFVSCLELALAKEIIQKLPLYGDLSFCST